MDGVEEKKYREDLDRRLLINRFRSMKEECLKLGMTAEQATDYLKMAFDADQLKIINDEGSEKGEMDIGKIYALAYDVWGEWIDMDDDYRKIMALWTVASRFNIYFEVFPYLFINAMKGSGKSRTLKLMAYLLDGLHTSSLTEAVMFRQQTPLMLDEAENLSSKEKAGLRELLNFAYKKGGVVARARKERDTEKWVIDAFPVYRPLMIANIWGLENVLESRTLTILLEKSVNPRFTRKIELFSIDPKINHLKLSLVQVVYVGRLILTMYELLTTMFNTSNTNLHTYIPSQPTLTYTKKDNNGHEKEEIMEETVWMNNALLMKERLDKSSLEGRDFELWLPLFIIARAVSNELFEETISIAERHSLARKQEDILENKDIAAIAHIINTVESSDFIQLSSISKSYLEADPDCRWMKPEFLSRMLKRHNLTLEKRRVSKGNEVRIDIKRLEMLAGRFGIDIAGSRENYKKQREEQSVLSDPYIKAKPDYYDRLEAGEYGRDDE